MTIRSALTTLCLLALTVSPAAAQGTSRTLTLDDVAQLKDVRDPHVSPDGQWVAYTVASANVEKDKRDSDVWMVKWDGSRQIRLTSSPDNESRPRWSPDGRYLAFVAARGDEDQKKKGGQIWLLDRSGGEAQQLTDIKGGIDDYAWSPDGKRLALVVNDPDPDDEPEKKEGWKHKTKPPIVIDRYAFKRDVDGYLRRLYTHLALFEVESKTLTPLTTGAFSDALPSWSPDGQRIAFVSERATPDPDRTVDTNIYVVDAKAGAEPTQLTTYPGQDEGRPAWSPDGTSIAYLQGDEPKYYAYELKKLAVVPSTGGAPRVLTAALDRAVDSPVWTADGASIVVGVEDDRTRYVAKVSVAGGQVQALTTGRRVVMSPSTPDGGKTIAVLAATAAEPPEVHALEGTSLRRLTTTNPWLKDVTLSSVEDVTFKAKDGTVVNGLLAKPPASEAGRRYPTILFIHGGPNGQDEHAFSTSREVFAANGFAVLQVNYRGSSGRGAAYQKAIYQDWGHLEVVDLLAGVDHVVSMGVADPDRLGIGGWSYGGILTNYTIATDSRFKAAASGASSSLQFSIYGTDQYIVQYEQEMGPPWKTFDRWVKVSYPFFQIEKIKTPTLFMGGEKDFNVPIAGTEQMYQALRTLGVNTQLIVYPGQFHGITVPSYVRDRYERYLDWFGRYLKPAASAPTAAGRKDH